MNLSSKMICPSCGKEMGFGSCSIGGTITTYQRVCSCGMEVLCVPMEKGYRYTVNLHNVEIDNKRKAAMLKIYNLECALNEAKRELEHM